MVVPVFALAMMGMSLHCAGAVGTAFRLECSHDGDGLASQSVDHVGDHMIFTNSQAVAGDLGRKMTISEMPRNTD